MYWYNCILHDSIMDWQTRSILIGVMVVTAIILSLLVRPLLPKLRRLAMVHPNGTAIFFSVLMIVWGAVVWYWILTTGDYTNSFAMAMSSLLVCAGLYFLLIQIFKKPR